MPDAAFESAFSELAHASLRETAPGLMEYLVGFQIIDKNDEESHAVAVFGFKVGSQWFYAPTFFMNGSLKGSDLLYVKNQDLFVPLQDNWVNYLLSKRPQLLGSAEAKEESELNMDQPDFATFSDPPTAGNSSKMASLDKYSRVQDWAKPFLPVYEAAIMGKEASDVSRVDLTNVLKQNPELAGTVITTMQGNVKFAEAVFDYYGPEVVEHLKSAAEAAKEAANESKLLKLKKPEIKPTTGTPIKAAEDAMIEDDTLGTVTVYTTDDIPGMVAGDLGSAVLTDAEKSQLMEGEMVVKDTRANSQKTKIYKSDYERRVQNPNGTGVYGVIGADGTTDECLVISDPKVIGKGRTTGVVTLVTKGGEAGNYPKSGIFVANQEVGDSTFNENLDSFMSSGIDPSSMTPGKSYVLLDENGVGTIPFKMIESVSNTDGTTQLKVYPNDDMNCRNSVLGGNQPGTSYEGFNGSYTETGVGVHVDSDPSVGCGCTDYESFENKPYSAYEYSGAKSILISDRDSVSEMKNVGDTLIIPKSVKAIKAGDKYLKAYDPASITDIEHYIMKSAAVIEVFTDGPELIIRHENGQSRMRKSAAAKELILDWGLDAEAAQLLVKEAKMNVHGCQQYFVKSAEPMGAGPTAPAMPAYPQDFDQDIGAAVVSPQGEFSEVAGMGEDPNAREQYNLMDDEEVQGVLQAAESGKKDIFDTAVLGSLVKTFDVDSVVDGYLPDIIRGMDRVGRILFMFYWHNESFKERYGRQELMDLEDALRNVFQAQGDLVIFLKQKTIQADPLDDALSIDIGALA